MWSHTKSGISKLQKKKTERDKNNFYQTKYTKMFES